MADGATTALADLALDEATSNWILVKALLLSSLDNRARAACVSRLWRDAASDPALLAVLWFDERSAGKLTDAVLSRLCTRSGAALRELCLDATQRYQSFTAAGVIAALRAGGCTGLLRLTLSALGWTWMDNRILSMTQAQQLTAACPAMEHSACAVRCYRTEDVATACALLPGPLALYVASDTGVPAARAALQLHPRVGALYLQHFTLKKELFSALSVAVHTNTTLKTLTLLGVGLDVADAVALGQGLRTNNTIMLLNLSCNSIGRAGAASLGEALRINATLRTLLLNYGDIGDVGVVTLAEALLSNTTITALDLVSNTIGDQGAAALAAVLRTKSTLTMLNLDRNGIGKAGAASLADALLTNRTLVSLKLAKNRVGAAGAASLAEVIRTNITLETLALSQSAIGAAGKAALVEALRSNSTLKYLMLHAYGGAANYADRRG